jgi:hypothetical protein
VHLVFVNQYKKNQGKLEFEIKELEDAGLITVTRDHSKSVVISYSRRRYS